MSVHVQSGMAIETAEELTAYNARRIAARTAIAGMGYGTTTRVAKDLDIALNTVSAVMSGKVIRPDVLGRVEGWLAAQE